jgi:hypothetical protein
MSKTCLLCQKPLSRIRVGGGEDFCSREHRNQYRLRQGMNRLTEANKVANVMRRRENPRLLKVTPVTGDSAFRSVDYSGARRPRAVRKTVMPPSMPKLQIHLPSSNGAQRSILYPSSRDDRPRSFSLLRWRVNRNGRVHDIPALHASILRPSLQDSPAGSRNLTLRPQKGPAMRVSLAAGFTLRQAPAHSYLPIRAFLYGRMIWRDDPKKVDPRDMPAAPLLVKPGPKDYEPISEVTGPAFRSGIDKSRTLGRHTPFILERRTACMDAEPMTVRPTPVPRFRIPDFQEREIGRAGARLVAFSIARPVGLAAGYRITSVPFAPQDSYATTFIQEQAN